jgi:hypothetical protein
MRRRRHTNANDSVIVGAGSAASPNGSPMAPLPPPTAAATRAEVTALSEQVRELREHLDSIVRGLTDHVDAQLAAVRADHDRVQAHVDDKVARLSVDQEVALSQVGGRLTQQVETIKAEQQAAMQALAQHVELALQQLAAQMNSHAERTQVAADEESRRVHERIAAQHEELRAAIDLGASQQLEHLGAMAAQVDTLRQQLAATTNQAAASAMTVMQLKERVDQIDLEALDAMREKITSLAGETALVRIEMDRMTGSIDDRFDRIQIRLTEVESKADSDADVTMAVQLERLDELERAVAEIDPDRFVTRDEWRRSDGETLADLDGETAPPQAVNGYAVWGQ